MAPRLLGNPGSTGPPLPGATPESFRMQKLVILDGPLASLHYYPEEQIVHHEFHGFVHGPEFRKVLEAGIELLRRHGATKWVSDDRKNGAIPREDGEWADNVWRPAAIQAGWKYWAMIQPEKIYGQMNVRRFVENAAADGVVARIFDSPVEALRWIRADDPR